MTEQLGLDLQTPPGPATPPTSTFAPIVDLDRLRPCPVCHAWADEPCHPTCETNRAR